MTTNNNERVYELMDQEGFISDHPDNLGILKGNGSTIFKGKVKRDLLTFVTTGGWRITTHELSNFFKDVTPAPASQSESTTTPSQKAVTSPLSSSFDNMYQSIYEDCKAVEGSLCIYKEGVVFLWEDSEYVINSPEDYDNLINSIKVLQSLQKVYTIEPLTNEGE